MNMQVLNILKNNNWITFDFLGTNKELNDILPKKINLTKENLNWIYKNGVWSIKNITKIVTNEDFNEPLHSLPKKLKSITFGKKFNQIIEFPENVEIINFGYNYNQKYTFPKNLKYISFSNFPIEGIKLEAYKYVCWYKKFERQIKLPEDLNYILSNNNFIKDEYMCSSTKKKIIKFIRYHIYYDEYGDRYD
jgi:hypothetical protein